MNKIKLLVNTYNIWASNNCRRQFSDSHKLMEFSTLKSSVFQTSKWNTDYEIEQIIMV